MFRDQHDNKKKDFKVTSRQHKQANNTRNSFLLSYTDSQGWTAYAEVQFFFHAYLPSELGDTIDKYLPQSHPGDSDLDSDEDTTGTSLHQLAFVRKIMVDIYIYETSGPGGGTSCRAKQRKKNNRTGIDSLGGRIFTGRDWIHRTTSYATSMFSHSVGHSQDL